MIKHYDNLNSVRFFNYTGVYVFILFFFFGSVSEAQNTNIRELEKQIENSEGAEKIQFLLDAADYYTRVAPDSGLQYSNEALALASELNDKKLIAKANYLSGFSNLQLKKNSLAWEDFSKSISYAQKHKDWSLVARNMIGQAQVQYNTLNLDSARVILESAEKLAVSHKFDDLLPGIYKTKARIYDKEGNLTEAIDFYLKAAVLFEAQKSESDLAMIDGNIGVVYMRLENEPEALKYLTRAMEYNEKNNNWHNLSINYNNLGALYQQMDSVEKSRFYYEKELHLAQKESNEYALARTYLNLANVLKGTDDYLLAGAYYDSSLYYSNKNNIEYGIIVGKLNYGDYYNVIGEYDKAIKILKEDKELLANRNLPGEEATIYAFLSRAYKGAGVYDSSLFYYEKYNHINDSIAGETTKANVLSLEKKYQSEKKERQISELEANASKQRLRNRFMITALLFLLIISAIGSLLLVAQRKSTRLKEQLIRQENEQLKNIMEIRNQELVSKALMVSTLNEQLDKFQFHFKDVKSSLTKESAQKIEMLVNDLSYSLPEQAWLEFEKRFESVHQSFITKLSANYPDLSPTELRLCSLLKLSMSSKEIALLTNRSVGSVDNIRSKVRNKLGLDAEANLTSFLMKL